MCLGKPRSFAIHVWKSILHRRLFSLYIVASVVLATAHIPIIVSIEHSTSVVHKEDTKRDLLSMPIMVRSRWNISNPPSSIFHIARVVIAACVAFWGVFWDVQSRKKEWALIRLYGGHPGYIAGFQYFCLTLLGTLIGGGIAFLIGSISFVNNSALLISLTIWAFVFFLSVSIGPILYTELSDTIMAIREEG